MTVVFPSKAITRRWDGALQARLLRAPLEDFVRFCAQVPVATGATRDSDNVASATVFLVQQGLAHTNCNDLEESSEQQQAALGHMVCVISRSLAASIGESAAWRVAALMGTARLLTPLMGSTYASLASADHTRRFQRNLMHGPLTLDLELDSQVLSLMNRPNAGSSLALSAAIASRMDTSRGSPHTEAAKASAVR